MPPEEKKKLAFDHGTRPVFVLLPADQNEKRTCQEYLEEDYAKLAKPPRTIDALRVGMLPSDAMVYVVHPYTERAKNPATQRFELTDKVHVSEPLDVSRYSLTTSFEDDGLGQVNVPAIVDALQLCCKNFRSGKVFSVRLSAEKEYAAKSARLFNS